VGCGIGVGKAVEARAGGVGIATVVGAVEGGVVGRIVTGIGGAATGDKVGGGAVDR
jgi:hypothetical protein